MKKQVRPLAIRYAGKVVFLCLLLILFAGNYAFCATYTWVGSNTGAVGNRPKWENTSNWTVGGFTPATYPGQGGTTTDVVQIGVTAYTKSQPTLSTNVTLASITFGDNSGLAIVLTINGVTLTAGTVTQMHNNATGGISTTITDGASTGTFTCTGQYSLGDTSTPSAPGGFPGTSVKYSTTLICDVTNCTMGSLVLNSTHKANGFGVSNFNNPVFTLNSGTLNVTDITATSTSFLSGNTATFNMGTSTTANTLNVSGTISMPTSVGGSISFLNGLANTSASTVNYTGTGAQTILTGGDAQVVSTPTTYGNLSFSNGGVNTLDAGGLTVGGTLVNNTGSTLSGSATAASTVKVTGTTTNSGTLNVNNDSWTFSSAVTNSGSYLPGTGTGTSTFSNGLTNSGTFTGGGGAVTITAGTGTLTNNSPGVVTGGAGTITIGTLTNNTGGNVNGNATAGAITVNGLLTNAGTITVNNGTMTFTGAASNTGSYLPGTGTGTSTFSNGLTNSGTFTGGAGAVTITAGTGTLTNTGTANAGTGTIAIAIFTNTSPGIFTGNITSGATNVSGATGNTGTITVNAENMTFTGLVTNSGTYTGGAGLSKFNGALTNTGPVAAGAGTITVTNFTNNSGGSFTGNTTTAATTTVSGSLTNGGTITVNYENISVAGAAGNTGTCADGTGTGAVTFGNSYTNSGTFTASAIYNAAGNQTITDNSTNGTVFANVQFQGSGIKTLAGTKGFAVSSSGTLTMAGTTTLATGGILTLNSDATGSAIVAVVPATCTFSGNVNVQRFIEGSSVTNRGYRLMSSPVFTGSPSGVNVYDLSYLATTLWVSGLGYAGNGFNVLTTENPSIYLFREDDPPPPSTTTVFTTGYNWKGVARINESPIYNIGIQAKNTTANVNDATTTIPVGNGILVFDRGPNTGGTAGKTVAPFIAPGNTTVTAIGQLNTGTINVIPWFTGSTSFSYTAANVSANVLTGGYALVGNPYAATINWEKYNNSNASGALTGTIGSLTIWEFNPTTKNYDTYLASGNANTTGELPVPANATGSATNFIASGMGFFVKATGPGQTLTFTENAKVTINGAFGLLNNLMGKPVATAAQPVSYMRLKLITDSVNNDDIVIKFDNKASAKFVNNEDAQDLGGSGSVESLSSFSSDSVALAINGWPFPGKQPQIIRLLTDATASGSYQLAVPEFGNMPQLYNVWLKDAFAADSVQLKLNTSYPFTIDKSNAATFGSNRFTVVVRQDTALMYKLLDFTATKVDHQSDVQLVWKTVNEENYTRFTVERSTDNGKTFNVVGGMLGTGAGTYSLVDKNPDNGRNLYRLKQEDINDSVTYSKVVDVQFGNLFSKLHIFPNPATHTINLAIAGQGYYGSHYSIKFMNSAGRIVKEVESSQPEWQGNISYLMPGTYLVRVVNTKTQNLVGENKFVKL